MDLIVEDLACARGGVRLLQGVGFRLPPGGAIELRGPNGIGKTTLLRTIAGLIPVAAGRVANAGDRIAYSGHADGVKATLTARENLGFWASLHGVSEVDAALAAFDLGWLADRPARALSAGQKRRLGLARLLVTGREVWLLDEPSVSLDAAAREMLAAAVRAHLGAGGSVLAATHEELAIGAERLDLSRFRAAEGAAGQAAGEARDAFAEALE